MEEKEEEEGERGGGDKLGTSFHCSLLPDSIQKDQPPQVSRVKPSPP